MKPDITNNGIIKTISQPLPINFPVSFGSCIHTRTATKISAGIIKNITNTVGRYFSRTGASQIPARKPMTTLGRAAIISTTGLIIFLIFGWAKSDV